ncbi:MAG TPA: Ppx/GppA phosphatase family protein [Acidobacteriota bacterium]|nr:Ppx/GppA phosphatase family protein [Acidobacteriota bacterium]
MEATKKANGSVEEKSLKLAAIDIGTNSIHMVIVSVGEHRIFEIIDREKEMVQLGKGSLMRGRLTPDAIERGLAALKAFRQIADSHKVDQIICTATSAVRESSNGREFVKMVKAQTGIDIRILSGTEEARMIMLAVRDVVDLKNQRALVVDIGGGSMELIVADARNIFLATSIKAGVIRLTERFMKSDTPSSKDLKALKKWLDKKLNPLSRTIQDLRPQIAVGTSGTMLALGELIKQNIKTKKAKDRDVMTIEEVEEINEILQNSTLQERLKMPGMDPKRADQIVAGGLLIEMMMEKCRVNEIQLCDRALREGLIADYLIKLNPAVPAKIQARELRSRSVLNLLHRWEIDLGHANHSAQLSLQLYDALAPYHKYGPHVRELMEYSALLHDIGRVISYPRHQRHGWYIVKQSNLIGFKPDEIDMIAAAIAYHRGKKPRKKDTYMENLRKKDRRIVKLLTGILRVADGMDRQHNQVITRIEARREGPDNLAIMLYSTQPALIPLRAAVERSDLLQRLLGLRQIEFRVESATQAAQVRTSAD